MRLLVDVRVMWRQRFFQMVIRVPVAEREFDGEAASLPAAKTGKAVLYHNRFHEHTVTEPYH